VTPQVQEVLSKLEAFMPTVDDAAAIPRETGQFLHAVVLGCKPKRAVEIGTSYGYSGVWIGSALAMSGGRLTTIDRLPHKSDAARENYTAAGLGDVIELRTGSADEVLAKLDGPIDFVFNDADKENCRTYIELLAPKLSPHAVIVTDNTTSHAEQLGSFVEWLRGRGEFFSTHVSVGSGLEMTVKIA
jgi:predicted O-methyltransferase YrrM